MKLNTILAFIFAGLLFSCDVETTSPDPVSQEAFLTSKKVIESMFTKNSSWNSHAYKKNLNAKIVEKPMKVRTAGTMQMVACDFGENYGRTIVEGKGNATHLGRFTLSLSYCFDENGPVEYIYAIQTAANGDELYSVVVGSNPAAHSLDFIYYGGTGRFENATGAITLFFNFDYENGTFTNYGEGTLSY